MCQKHFTHLHLHTDYSLLDGAISIDKLIDHGKKNNRKALAISDHGNIFGAVKFFEKCKKAGMKPILGMEAYITEDIGVRNIQNRYYHLLLLVKNKQGYKNMCRLIAESYLNGFYFKPRIDYQLLKKYSEGLIATSTCLGGHIPQLLLEKNYEEVDRRINFLGDLFGKDYFLEVQPPYLEEQRYVNKEIFLLEKKYNIPIVATGDCHYFSKEDRYAHEVMLAVQTRTTMADPNRMTFGKSECHIQDIAEFNSFFPDRDDIIWRSGEIADSCDFAFETNKLFFPKYEVPEKKMTPDEYFISLSKEGFETLLIEKKIPEEHLAQYHERLDFELQMITKMGFATYFLIVSDFIRWAKQNTIPVGPGRGSVAGSLVAWALSITDIDPIKYNLFFERFLNPERISMPDIDIDFCFHGRERVINYVREKYGHDHVGQIITFGSMLSKGVVKDVARALGFSFEDANSITELIPDELKITLDEAIAKEPKLKQMIEKNSKIEELFDIAKRLEGLTRHASKHAAGVVISPEPIAEVLPIYIPPKTTEIVTQYAMTELELLGFLKIDFLGLKNLTLIQGIIDLLKKNKQLRINILEIPMDDKKTFQLLQKGETAGIFQLESNGIRDVLRRLCPTTFEEIIAVNALYRPGPLGSGMVDDFIERKHGRQAVDYFFPVLKPVLEDTYGVIVYQEQVMQIANILAGYSLGESDLLRRAMGKKKPEEMAKQKDLFVKKATEKGFDAKKIITVFELMEYFAGYGFNKAHSAAYALIAYQTAYLKANYPIEFMSCLISLELNNPDKSVEYLTAIRSSNITLYPPAINTSGELFTPESKGIRWGLLGIKNVGGIAIANILTERETQGKFKNLVDFCSRIDLRVCNKRVIESLIVSGACDVFPHSRSEMLINLDYTMEFAHYLQEKKLSKQLDLFDFEETTGNKNEIGEKDIIACLANWKATENFTITQILESEKEILGMYLSKHPLDNYETIKNIYQCSPLSQLKKKKEEWLLLSIVSIKEIKTKKMDLMAFVTAEDQEKKIELIFFPKVYEKYSTIIKDKGYILACGDTNESTETIIKMKVGQVISLDKFSYESIEKLELIIDSDKKINYLKNTLESLPQGKQKITLRIIDNNNVFLHALKKKYLLSEEIIQNFLKEEIAVRI